MSEGFTKLSEDTFNVATAVQTPVVAPKPYSRAQIFFMDLVGWLARLFIRSRHG